MAGIRTFTGTDPNYDRLGYLGSGTFGQVTKVRKKSDGRIYACKTIDISSGSDMLIRAIEREIGVLQSLRGCQNIVQWHDDISFNQTRSEIHLHMDFYSDGDLKHCIDQHYAMGERFSDSFALDIFRDLINALKDCHAKGIVHRDIKPANILLHGDTAYLADFGLGKFSSSIGASLGSLGTSGTGTPAFMAPENFGPRPIFGPKTDIFALGCVMYQLCELRLAFRSEARNAVPSMESARLPSLESLIMDCLALDVRYRPNTETVHSRYYEVRNEYMLDIATRQKATKLSNDNNKATSKGTKGEKGTAKNRVGVAVSLLISTILATILGTTFNFWFMVVGLIFVLAGSMSKEETTGKFLDIVYRQTISCGLYWLFGTKWLWIINGIFIVLLPLNGLIESST